MALVEAALTRLETNSKDTYQETTRLLIKIADNVLQNPTNTKLRTLQKSNVTVAQKILNIQGGLECLRVMGFEEKEECFVLPPAVSLHSLQSVRNEIVNRRESYLKDPPTNQNEIPLPAVDSPPRQVPPSADKISDSGSSSSTEDSDEEASVSSSQGAIPKSVVRGETESKVSATNMHMTINLCDIPRVELPPLNYISSNNFLKTVELNFHQALSYSYNDLKQRAKRLIPLTKLETAAQERLRALQKQVKKGNCSDQNVSTQEMLLLELLDWFKNDFFTWVDSPACAHCRGETTFSHMSNDPALQNRTNRVEMHKCTNCHALTSFPRYNDLYMLLITRKGRCGEWANTFTLMCCAMGWDARFVVDQTDHVWTEVYSFAQKRWLHCDPCENVCDCPLMYENGWGKKLTYVMAYSHEELQDVTWRYSSNHKTVLSRRSMCSESELIKTIMTLRENRQKNFSAARKDFLTNRILSELVEMLLEKKPSEADRQGRTSGSLAWRLARGETQELAPKYCWTMFKDYTDDGNITIRYSTSLNCYEYVLHDGSILMQLEEWQAGVYSASDIFLKKEQDWKMVYLARRESADKGIICWKFEVEDAEKTVIDTVEVTFQHQIYETGNVDVTIDGGSGTSVRFPTNVAELRTSALSGCKQMFITAHLSGGKGDVAWQHAQLFRQSMTENIYPFSVKFSFKSKK